MHQSVVRSVSIDYSKVQCRKLRNRSVLRSCTPDICSSRPKEKIESPKNKKSGSVQYNSKTRKAVIPLIGEVNLPREEFHLVSPANSNAPTITKLNLNRISLKAPKILQSFISDAKSFLVYKKDYLGCLQKSIKDLKSLNFLSGDHSDFKKVVHSKAFQDPKSRIFLKAVKNGQMELVKNLLRENPLIIQSFDNAGLTALHWCTLRNRMEIAKLLINNKALVDATDIVKRTPLLLAVKRGNFDFVQMFLINRADPCIVPDPKKSIVDYSKKYLIQEILRKAVMLHKQLKKVAKKERDEKWRNDIIPRFLNFDSIKPVDLKSVRHKSILI